MAKKKEEESQPLLEQNPLLLRRQSTVNPPDDELTPAAKAIAETFKHTANLAKLLPTGTVLAFQVLSPLFSREGDCLPANRAMTAALILACALACFVLSFTDSFRDASGTVRYGFATFSGMWVIDGTAQLPAGEAAEYRLRPLDFAHGFMSVMVFAAVALLDSNVVSCFYPLPSEDVKQVIAALPVAMGIVGSGFFVAFPTSRHGIGFPLSTN
ncbi:hypothetical protein HPP92_023572 [Vanilla planifolia]|uniref:Uncharacterized protein n=1 Tax=Vanilla planifolia TaxID=51239 RepID=A0A835PLD0_VANPL|nr:hypothetical protein HPP92_023837 [Vanilla planifolia]KAG0455784.1 hypothetical protein HPP92_023572 [Vanilla planifolia]